MPLAQRRPRSSSRTSARRSIDASPLSELDRQLLETLSSHRVVTQTQLERLFDQVPSRTLRYRTRRLHEARLLGRSRPYRDSGSAPFHLWPTRRADALVRGEPAPRGGERRAPNPLFLAHAAALTELYVALVTEAPAHGLDLCEFRREGDAREPFRWVGGSSSLAPDAFLMVRDEESRSLCAFVEIDCGTMSHRRLRAKADIYAAYDASAAWTARHRFCPALLFLTTTDARAQRFLTSLQAALERGSSYRGGDLTAAAGAVVLDLGRPLRERCLFGLDLNTPLTLRESLEVARLPYDRERAAIAARERAEAEARERLLSDATALRVHLREHAWALRRYLEPLGRAAESAMRLTLDSDHALGEVEERALTALAASIGDDLLDLRGYGDWQPDEVTREAAAALVSHVLAQQQRMLAELSARHGDGATIRSAAERLASGELLAVRESEALPAGAERDEAGRREQETAREAYFQLRDREARRLAWEEGVLRRFVIRREEFHPLIDRERLRFCWRCREIAYPQPAQASRASSFAAQRCHYCGSRGLARFDPDAGSEGAPGGSL